MHKEIEYYKNVVRKTKLKYLLRTHFKKIVENVCEFFHVNLSVNVIICLFKQLSCYDKIKPVSFHTFWSIVKQFKITRVENNFNICKWLV